MSSVRKMLDTHPRRVERERDALIACVEACFECAQTCTACADACLGEEMVQRLARCIRLNLDCSDVCVTTGNLLSRQTAPEWSLLRAQLEACAEACRLCGEECAGHADHHEHCRVCAESCRSCEKACRRLLERMAA